MARECHNCDAMLTKVPGEVIDEIKKRILRSLQVIKDEKQRHALGQLLGQPPKREVDLNRISRRLVEAEPEQKGEIAGCVRRLLLGEQRSDQHRQLLSSGFDRVASEDAGGKPHYLGGRVIGRLLFIGKAPAPQGSAPTRFDFSLNLSRQPGLSYPGGPEKGNQLRVAAHDSIPNRSNQPHFPTTANERGSRSR